MFYYSLYYILWFHLEDIYQISFYLLKNIFIYCNWRIITLQYCFGFCYTSICGEGNGTPLQYSCLESPWTEEPGGLQSMGSLRVGHN